MLLEQEVVRHYTHGALEGAILDALVASGKDIDRLAVADLAGVDEFHLGWREATIALAEDLGLGRDLQVLDVGSGIGGPARYFAQAYGCRVTGIDITQEFVDVANALTRRCGLADLVTFRPASALALPFADGAFDAATLIHVGMNVQDKARLFAEAHRVLKPGGRFGVYDIVRVADGDLSYPVPWATTAETSFIEPAHRYRQLLAAAGFALEHECDRSDLTIRLGREMRATIAKQGPPPLGLHILMGATTPQRLSNMMSALENRMIAPVQFIVRAG
jgi:SAM-dependent methyltransferase